MWTEERLNKMLTTPSEALSVELGRLEGDILVLGAGGKMGPTLCVLAKNALRAAGVEKRVIAVSRFSDPLVVELLRENGVEMYFGYECSNLILENEVCKVLSYKGKVFGVEAPNFVVLEVTKTDPGFKGNTATNTLKPATLETGAEIRVPLFINEGDMIRIDTRTGEYMERA